MLAARSSLLSGEEGKKKVKVLMIAVWQTTNCPLAQLPSSSFQQQNSL